MESSEEKSIENTRENFREEKKKKKKLKVIIISVIVAFLLIGGLSVLLYPRLKLKGNATIKIKLDSSYVEQGATASIAGQDISKDIKINGNIDTSRVGKYEVEYSVKEGFITRKVKRVVEVIDDVLPNIELKGSTEAVVCPNKEYEEEGYTALDNYDGDITSNVVVTTEENEIIYSVKDSSGNGIIAKRTIEKKDTEKPKITIQGNQTVYMSVNSSYSDKGAKAEDNCDGDLTSSIVKSGSVNNKKVGTYKIKYEVTDSSSNTASIERTVIVYDQSSVPSGAGKKGTIYLTFDDGPSSTITPSVLKILKEKGVKATFFVINHSDSLNYLIKQEYDEGHTVALHSYTHNYKTIYSSKEAYFNDLKKISDKVKSITGVESKIMRFPGGTSNTVSRNYSKGIMTYLSNEVLKRGYHYFDWNVSSGDAGNASTKGEVYKNVINGLSYNKANVVLMHDYENNYKTLNALSDIIDYGLAKGYKFEVIDMSTPLVTHKPNN